MTGPLILDKLYAKGPKLEGGPIPKSIWAIISNAKYNAQRFLFDEEASEVAGEFSFECPDLIFENSQFAIPPYPVTYIEVDSPSFFRKAKRALTVPDQDDRLGYLVSGNYVYVLFERDGFAATAYWRYKILPPGQFAGPGNVNIKLPPQMKIDIERDIFETYRKVGFEEPIDLTFNADQHYAKAVMFGSAIEAVNNKIWPSFKRTIDACCMEWLDPNGTVAKKGLDATTLRGFMGDVRNYLALTLWLNQPSRVRIIGVPPGRKLVRGKQVPYLSYNTVNIKLGRIKTVRRAFLLANERRSPKGHDVRGHFRHRGGYRPCVGGEEHPWPVHPDDNGHWICPRCHRERWHVKSHRRGDAGKGYVLKSYELTI